MPRGVSIIICTHNGATRLPQTLAHFAGQIVPPEVKWELILVDNASTDNTAEVALSSWPSDAPVPLYIVKEPELGLSNARKRGLLEAKFDIVSFIDDDNWVYPDWIATAFEIMTKHPDIGACGGLNEAFADVDLPWWFKDFQNSYAVGPQGEQAGDITWGKGVLSGAGLTIRKPAWEALMRKGFRPLLVGHKGKTLTCGEDYELCLALCLEGWRIWYEPKLRLRHYLPANRLKWQYLLSMVRKWGAATIYLAPYYIALDLNLEGFEKTWMREITKMVMGLPWHLKTFLMSIFSNMEGNRSLINTEIYIGRFFELLKDYRSYDRRFTMIQNGFWHLP